MPGLSYPDDPTVQSGNFTPPICHWCNPSPKMATSKWTGSLSSTTPSSLPQCYPQLNSIPEGWNMVLPLARNPTTLSYSIENNRSFPSSPGSATDLSPAYSEAKGYFDFIPIQNSHYDHSAPISPGSLSVHGSDNEAILDHTPPISRKFYFSRFISTGC
jgi:hypothetical protein